MNLFQNWLDSVIDKANPFEFMDVTQQKLQIDLIELCNKDMQHKTKEKKNILMCKMRIGDMMHEHSFTIYESCALPNLSFHTWCLQFSSLFTIFKIFTIKKLDNIFLYMKKGVCWSELWKCKVTPKEQSIPKISALQGKVDKCLFKEWPTPWE